VKVAEGYGRNYLLPKKLAIKATAANKAVIDQMKASAVRRSVKEKSDAEALAKQFDGVSLHFTRRAGENDQLFGSVTSSDIAHELEARGFNVDRRKIEVGHPMKTVGEYTIHIKLHREVSVPVKVTVTKEAEVPAKA
jgi:large subunit ribosomal protein L9